jgi:hypothetical protein
MLDEFFPKEGGPGPGPELESEPVVEPKVKVVSEPAEAVAEVVTEESAVAEPVVESMPELEPDELETLKSQNKALLEHVEKLSGQVVSGRVAPAEPAAHAVVKPTVPLNFLEGVTIDDLLEAPEKLNAVLINVAERSATAAMERTLRAVPELVVSYISRHSAMNRMVDDFYKEHPDLASVKQTVAAVANTVHSENAGWNADQVFKETAVRTRKLLGLKQQALASVKPTTNKPAFAKARGTRREEPAVSGLQNEINELLVDI